MEHIIGGKFKLGRKIGRGSFGELYLGITIMSLFIYIYYLSSCFVDFDVIVLQALMYKVEMKWPLSW